MESADQQGRSLGRTNGLSWLAVLLVVLVAALAAGLAYVGLR